VNITLGEQKTMKKNLREIGGGRGEKKIFS